MKAVIFVGGFGTRLRPLTCNTPKAMVPVFGEPFINLIFSRLKNAGITDIVLAISHLSNQIEDYYGNGEEFGLNIEYVHEDEDRPLGTGGALRNAAKNIKETFLAMNGDVISDIDIKAMLDVHQSNHASMTIALHRVKDPSQYGLVETDSCHRVLRFIEKPRVTDLNTDTINAGIYIMEPEVVDLIPDDVKCSLEHETFPLMLSKGMAFYSYTDDTYWLDIGTPQKYCSLHTDMMNNQVKNDLFVNNKIITCGNNIPDSAKIYPPIYIGKNAQIGQNITLKGPIIIGNSAVIEDGAKLENVVLWDDVHIGKNVNLSVVAGANHITFEDDTYASSVVFGDLVTVKKECKISNQDVYPGETIEHSSERES